MTPSTPDHRIRRCVVVRGLVQGVGFRWSTGERARSAGLDGHVANRPDGSVYVEVDGSPEAVEQMIGWLRTGPPSARVESVEVAECDPPDPSAAAASAGRGFSIL